MSASEAIRLLEAALTDEQSLASYVAQFQRLVLNDDSLSGQVGEVLREVAYDLEYYAPDAKLRGQDTAYFGSERALAEIGAAVAKLRTLA